MKTWVSILTCVFSACFGPLMLAGSTPTSRHVVVVVWDGMRPDFVTAEDTPALWKLAQQGITFRDHHSVYPSATHVNGTAMVTGVYPGHNGLTANYDYRPDIDGRRFVSTEHPTVVRKGDQLSGGKYIALPTIAELVRKAGGRTVIAGAKTVTLLFDRNLDPNRAGNCVNLFAGDVIPQSALGPVVSGIGPFPRYPMYRHDERDAWTTKALTDFFWKEDLPVFSLLWLSEPDGTEHESAPGAEDARRAIKSADTNLATVLAALDRKGARATTDVFVVSDHGFSTIKRAVDMSKVLNGAGFRAMTDFQGQRQRGDIILVGNGGTVLFYVIEHDAAVTKRLVEFLQQSDFAGVIFSKQPMEGTFTLDKAAIETARSADVVMAFRWDDSKNQFGVAGTINSDWNRKVEEGTHATLSRFDMHNILFAAGPDFRRGETDDLPTGNIDLAPTILRILGVTAPEKLDGRVLSEAMVETAERAPKSESETIEATKEFSSGRWKQSLRISRVGSTQYIDEGNGAFFPSK